MDKLTMELKRAFAMIRHPERWPVWPKLPLRRIGSALTDDNCLGYLMEIDDSVLPIVYLGNIHALKHTGTERFKNFRELLATWRID